MNRAILLISIMFMLGILAGCDAGAGIDDTDVEVNGSIGYDVRDDIIDTQRTATPEVISLDIDDIRINSSILLNPGVILDVFKEGSLERKLVIEDIPSGRELLMSIDNSFTNIYYEEDEFQVSDEIFGRFIDIDHQGGMDSSARIEFFIKEIERFPDILIEEDIGMHRYLRSHEVDDKYIAEYDFVNVTVIPDGKISMHHSDRRNMIYLGDQRIYRVDDEQRVAWMSHHGGKTFMIEVESFSESLISSYLERYPSYLSVRDFCTRMLEMTEGGTEYESFSGVDMDIHVEGISASDVSANITVNDMEHILYPKNSIIIDDVVIILDDIVFTEDENHAVICIS